MTLLAADTAATRVLDLGTVRFAHRLLGPDTGTPLVLLQRFRGTMDDWDPLFLDALARHRRVIIFDNAGIGRSSGEPADSMKGMADAAAQFIRALGLGRVDVLGWSLGGAVAQMLTLDHPGLVRRLVVAGSGPGGVPDSPAMPAKVWGVAGKPVNDDEDFLYLFFPETPDGVAAGREHLARLGRHAEGRGPLAGPAAVRAQATAIADWGSGQDSAVGRLAELTRPTLIANGFADVMVPAYHSYFAALGMPHAQLLLYPDAGHGFLFQRAEEFAAHVDAFLAS